MMLYQWGHTIASNVLSEMQIRHGQSILSVMQKTWGINKKHMHGPAKARFKHDTCSTSSCIQNWCTHYSHTSQHESTTARQKLLTSHDVRKTWSANTHCWAWGWGVYTLMDHTWHQENIFFFLNIPHPNSLDNCSAEVQLYQTLHNNLCPGETTSGMYWEA